MTETTAVTSVSSSHAVSDKTRRSCKLYITDHSSLQHWHSLTSLSRRFKSPPKTTVVVLVCFFMTSNAVWSCRLRSAAWLAVLSRCDVINAQLTFFTLASRQKNTHFRNIIYSLNDKFGMFFNFLFLKKNISILFCKFLLSNIAANYVT